jgi:hypothetical protein
MAKKKDIEFDSCRKDQKKYENMHVYANFNPENELILQQNSECEVFSNAFSLHNLLNLSIQSGW